MTPPILLPDELLASMVARWARIYLYRQTIMICRRITNAERPSLHNFFPNYLSQIASYLNSFYPTSEDDLRNKHTMFPLIAPFCSGQEYDTLKRAMGSTPTSRSQLTKKFQMACGLTGSIALRFCPLCVVADKEKTGSSYFRRSHQAPLLQICPIHFCDLLSSEVGTDRYVFTALDDIKTTSYATYLNLCDAQCYLARDIVHILANYTSGTNRERTRSAMIEIAGAINFRKVMADRWKLLIDSVPESQGKITLNKAYNESLAQMLQEKYNVRTALRSAELYSLFSRSFGKSLQEFLSISERIELGPWACASAGNPCSGIPTIKSFRRTADPFEVRFICPQCGVVYFRAYPLVSPAFGPIPMRLSNRNNLPLSFYEDWSNPRLTQGEIAKKYNRSQACIGMIASREKLPKVARRGRRRAGTRQGNGQLKRPIVSFSSKRNRKRKRWLEIIKERATSHAKLNRESTNLLVWLCKNDEAWYSKHSFTKYYNSYYKDHRKVSDEIYGGALEILRSIRPALEKSKLTLRRRLSNFRISQILSQETGISVTALIKNPTISREIDYISESDEDAFNRRLNSAKVIPNICANGFSGFLMRAALHSLLGPHPNQIWLRRAKRVYNSLVA